MKKQLFSLALVALFATGSFVATAQSAAAERSYHRSVSAHGPYRGYNKNVNRSCANGSCNGHRSVQTDRGYGYNADHHRSCEGGSCASSTTVRANNGNVWTRDRGATNHGDGSASWYSNTTGSHGGTVSRSGTASWSQD